MRSRERNRREYKKGRARLEVKWYVHTNDGQNSNFSFNKLDKRQSYLHVQRLCLDLSPILLHNLSQGFLCPSQVVKISDQDLLTRRYIKDMQGH